MNINKTLQLPHHSDREGHPISLVVLHYPAPNLDHKDPYSAEAVYESLLNYRYSYHYYIEKSGKVWQFVPDDRAAWHAGKSSFNGESHKNTVNHFSLGVCLQNNGGEEYGDDIIWSCASLCRRKALEYGFCGWRVCGHNFVAPGRRSDPGRRFPWHDFYGDFSGYLW